MTGKRLRAGEVNSSSQKEKTISVYNGERGIGEEERK